MMSQEEWRKMLEDTLEKLGEPWKMLPLEKAIKFVSDYEVVSSETVGDTKVLLLASKGKVSNKA